MSEVNNNQVKAAQVLANGLFVVILRRSIDYDFLL